MAATIHISGLEELRQRLDPARLRELLPGILERALQPTVLAIRGAAPVRTGKLAKGVRLRIGARRGRTLSATIGSVAYGHLVEYGHRLVAGGRVSRARTLAGGLRARLSGRFTGRVIGQVPPHPFARPVIAGQEAMIAASIQREVAAVLNGAV